MNKSVCIVSAVIPPSHSGAGLSAFKYAFRLHKKGQLGLLLTRTNKRLSKKHCMHILGEYDEKFLSKIKTTSAKLYHKDSLLLKFFYYPIDFLLMWTKIVFILLKQRKNYQILHCFSPTWFSFFSIITGKAFGKKVLLEITLLDGDDPEYVAKYDWFKLLYQRRNIQYKLADAITCNSPALIKRCNKKSSFRSKTFLIPRAYNKTLFSVAPNKEIIKNKLSIINNYPVLLFVGGVIPRKGVLIAIDVIKRIKSAFPNVVLLVVGPKDHSNASKEFKQTLKKTIEDNSLQENVQFTGYVTNVNDYMKASDFFVFPSKNEGLPNVVIEAMACGNVVIMNEIPGISQFIVHHSENGFIVANNDPVKYATIIADLMANTSKMTEISNNAIRSVKQKFSPNIIDEKYAQAYRSLSKT